MSGARKTHKLVVAAGTYEANGETKKRWRTVGVAMKGEHGPFLLIDSTFNFAAVAEEPGGSVLVSMYEPDYEAPPAAKGPPKVRRQKATSRRKKGKDDIPF